MSGSAALHVDELQASGRSLSMPVTTSGPDRWLAFQDQVGSGDVAAVDASLAAHLGGDGP
jgi:hypothetical protein